MDHAELERQLQADFDTLETVVPGLDRLEAHWNDSRVSIKARPRGYFTPDEDDSVRQMLLAYRNYRVALHEIIFRTYGYEQLEPAALQLRRFLIGYAASLTLYARSLRLIEAYEQEPLVRAKLNEPDSKFELESGFFDEVLRAYSSLGNYRGLMAATSFWRSKRRVIATLVAEQQTGWSWLIDLILKEQNLVRRRLLHVLWCRLRYDWRTFFQTALRPVRKTRYNIRSIIGTAGANLRTTGHYRPGLKPSTLAQLHQLLRPGDILLIRAEKKLTSAILPGFWAHAALFVGGPCELESLGAARHPYVSKHLADVGSQNKGLGCVIEAISPRVRIQPLHRTLFADHVLVIRPNLASEGIVGAICEAFGHVGKPYDFEFDFNVSTRIVCTELIYRCYHNHGSIAFPLTKRLGRYTLTGDDMARILLDAHFAASADSAEPFQAVALVLTTGADKIEFTPPGEIFETLRNIQAGWRPLNSTEAAHA